MRKKLEFRWQLFNMSKKHTLCTLLLFLYFDSIAQGGDDFVRSIGKIYAVVGVILVLFLGIVFYLYRLDKKIKNLENNQDE